MKNLTIFFKHMWPSQYDGQYDNIQMEERLDREIEEEKAAAAQGIPWVQSPERSKTAEEGNATVTTPGDAEEEATGRLFNRKYK